MKAIFVGALGAIAIQPLIFGLWFLLPAASSAFPPTGPWMVMILLVALIVAAVIVLGVGVPAFLALRRMNRVNSRSVAGVGLLIAAICDGILTWPLRYHGYSSAGNWFGHYVSYYVDGTPTLYGWLSFVQGMLLFGVHGVLGGLVFYYLWHRQARVAQPHR